MAGDHYEVQQTAHIKQCMAVDQLYLTLCPLMDTYGIHFENILLVNFAADLSSSRVPDQDLHYFS
jgi:hypothetical protein